MLLKKGTVLVLTVGFVSYLLFDSSFYAAPAEPDGKSAGFTESTDRLIEKASQRRAVNDEILKRFIKGKFLVEKGRFDEAGIEMEKIRYLDEDNKAARELEEMIKKGRSGDSSIQVPTTPSAFEVKETKPLSGKEKEKTVKILLERGERLAELEQYDLAVDEIEKVFLIDPSNSEASHLIDRVKKEFIRKYREREEEESELEEKIASVTYFSEDNLKKLIKENKILEAKILLSRLELLYPENKKLRKYKKTILKKEKKQEEQ